MSASFIGCKISLISKSEIRYEGILYTIDTKESTIALAKVRSFGTEDRVTDKPVAPRSEVYEYIIFRASDIKDLLVDDPPSGTPALSDPAIIQAQHVGGSSSTSFPSPGPIGSRGSPSPSAFPGLIGSNATSSAPGVPVSVSGKSQTSQLSNVLASGNAGVIGAGRRSQGSRGASPGPRPKSPAAQRDRRQRNRSGGRPEGGNNFQSQQNRDNRRQVGNGSNNFRGGERSQQTRDGFGRHQDGFGRNQDGFVRNQDRGGPRGNQQNRNDGRGRSDWPAPRNQNQQGQQNQQQNRQPHRRPKMLDVRKLEEFDFETANAEFEKLTKDVEDLKISGDKKDGDGDAKDDSTTPKEETYNSTKSFFDSISCEALERQKGNVNRHDRRQERKLNQETFGVSGFYNRGWRGGRGGRGGYNNRGGYRNFNNHHGPRQYGGGSGGRGGQNRGHRGPRPEQEATATA